MQDSDIRDLIELRHRLHSLAEPSNHEEQTSRLITEYLENQGADRIIGGIGGYGLAAVFEGNNPGPQVLLRADLDALPIPESIELPYASERHNCSHKCGHDGHMTILAGVARALSRNRPEKGSVVLFYQPAEEIGKGAARVLADSRFEQIKPDYVFALHNLPGFKKNSLIYRHDTFASASSGMIVELLGETSHAAEPHAGKSPALAVSQMINALSAVPQFHTALHEASKVTVIHARLGEIAFGTSPGYAQVMATLRAHTDEVMSRLTKKCSSLAEGVAKSWQLGCKIRWDEHFPATVNDPQAVKIILETADELGLEKFEQPSPFPWSEDFGHFTGKYKGALFGIGAGKDQPALHHPTYDFPDDLIETGVKIFVKIIEAITVR
ncbi:MAG: amidohydrolase [candidate division Zixibacteria bacterium]|nr:amidohydrolase [candidate division Zixibacteria bacterium]